MTMLTMLNKHSSSVAQFIEGRLGDIWFQILPKAPNLAQTPRWAPNEAAILEFANMVALWGAHLGTPKHL